MTSYYGICLIFCILHIFKNVLIVESVENTEHSSVLSVVSYRLFGFHRTFDTIPKPNVHTKRIRNPQSQIRNLYSFPAIDGNSARPNGT